MIVKFRTLMLLLIGALMVTLVFSIAHAAPPSDTLTPNEDITNGWKKSPLSGTWYDKIQTDDGWTTIIYAGTGGAMFTPITQEFGLPDISPGGYTITDVTVYAVWMNESGNPDSSIVIWTNSQKYTAPLSLGTVGVWTTSSHTWTNNPSTGLPWTVGEVNDLHVGVQLVRHGDVVDQVGVTQLYVVVDEVPQSVVPEAPLGTIAIAGSMILALCTFTLYKRGRIKL